MMEKPSARRVIHILIEGEETIEIQPGEMTITKVIRLAKLRAGSRPYRVHLTAVTDEVKE